MFVAKHMVKIQLSFDQLAPPTQGFIVPWFMGTAGLTMPYYFTSLAKGFYFLKEI